jgi:hypothetical protein
MEDLQTGPSAASASMWYTKADEYAGHAPSHRAAWRDDEKGGYRWNSKKDIHDGRRSNPYTVDEEDEEDDTKKVSNLAKSVPVNIRQPLQPLGFVPPDLEPKTSLSEREGYFVPPLKAAMKKTVRMAVPTSPASGPSRVDKEDVQPGVTKRDGFVPPHIQIREEDKAMMKASGGSRSIYDK